MQPTGLGPLRPGLMLLCLLLTFLSLPVLAMADEADVQATEKAFDPGKIIIEHVLDAYEWHIADIGDVHISLPLPVILFYEGKGYFFFSHRFEHGDASYKGFRIAAYGPSKGRIVKVLDDGKTIDPHASFLLDLSFTKNALAIFISAVVLCLIFIGAARRYQRDGHQMAPRGLQSFLEPIILFVRDDIALPSIGPRQYMRFAPYLLTLFFFIFVNNLLGLVPFFPGGANVTGNISVTMVLALFTFFTMHIFANKGYWQHVFNTPGVPVWLKLPIPLMPIIELVAIIIKPFVLMVRLFANITAGHLIILGFVSLIFVLGDVSSSLGWAISPLSVIFVIFMNFLELLVAFLQAYVFTLFSAIFIGMAVPEGHH